MNMREEIGHGVIAAQGIIMGRAQRLGMVDDYYKDHRRPGSDALGLREREVMTRWVMDGSDDGPPLLVPRPGALLRGGDRGIPGRLPVARRTGGGGVIITSKQLEQWQIAGLLPIALDWARANGMVTDNVVQATGLRIEDGHIFFHEFDRDEKGWIQVDRDKDYEVKTVERSVPLLVPLPAELA